MEHITYFALELTILFIHTETLANNRSKVN